MEYEDERDEYRDSKRNSKRNSLSNGKECDRIDEIKRTIQVLTKLRINNNRLLEQIEKCILDLHDTGCAKPYVEQYANIIERTENISMLLRKLHEML